jgi:HEPN domain-containing protein
MNTLDLVKEWRLKAASDLKNVALLMKSGEPDLPNDTICFHCQQAVEKFLKAFLVYHDTEFPYTHNLKDLVDLAATIDPEIARFREKVEQLTPYAVEIRYPGDFWMPDLEETQNAYCIAQDIQGYITIKLDALRGEGQSG